MIWLPLPARPPHRQNRFARTIHQTLRRDRWAAIVVLNLNMRHSRLEAPGPLHQPDHSHQNSHIHLSLFSDNRTTGHPFGGVSVSVRLMSHGHVR